VGESVSEKERKKKEERKEERNGFPILQKLSEMKFR